MAAIIFAALALGLWAHYLPKGTPLRVDLLTIHKSLGVTALALVVLRVIVRLASKAPPYRPPLSAINKLAAHAAHGLLYVVMVTLPLSGYVNSMAGGHGFNWFGLFPVPNFVKLDKATEAGAGQAHLSFAWIIAALLLAHIAAALWHGLVLGDGVLARMLPSLSASGPRRFARR